MAWIHWLLFSIALFLLAHKMVDLYPESAIAWFAVGCYYYLIGEVSYVFFLVSDACLFCVQQ